MKSKTTTRSHTRSTARPAESASATDHYQREKARRAKQAAPQSELMAAAKREYLALLEADAAKGKGGRPKKKAARPAPAQDDDLIDDADETREQPDEHAEEQAGDE
jgi:polyphosphate kinase 2 (PPK2 family)